MKLIGIDPGDRWVGLAGIRVRANTNVEFYSAVLDRTGRDIVGVVDTCLASADEVYCEDFRARPQGHQSFNEMKTPRLIGALEYACIIKGIEMKLFPPGPNTEFEQIVPVIARMMIRHMKFEQWNHSMSAWRVLVRSLFGLPMMNQLRAMKESNFSIMNNFPRQLWKLEKQDFRLGPFIWTSDETD